jgi:mycothiol synthase
VSTEPGRWHIDRRDGPLARDQVAEVLALAAAAADNDGTYPLAEQVVLQLRHGGDTPASHLLARDPAGRLAGYAHLDLTDPAAGAAAELVVHPPARRRGCGRELATAALAIAGQSDPAGRLRVWAHGDHPAATALARSMGFARTRVLLQLRRSLLTGIAEPQLPPGVVLRPFRPGEDDRAWLAVNARAFADHPEQGRFGEHDLQLRCAEPWFDPAGFLLAVRQDTDQLLGFHWTKVHGEPNAHHPGPIGEVYVLGVDPAAHGLRLGTALTLAGLHYLRGRGLEQAMLYVDESNAAAVALYTRLGFTRWSVDVTFTGSLPPPAVAGWGDE